MSLRNQPITPVDQGVSVIVPAYNYAHFLGHAIQSALSQEYRHLEVIIIDDGSTDNTREIVEQFQDTRIRYIYQTNAGLSAARNTGIRNAVYPFVCFLDADDLLQPALLRRAVESFALLPIDFVLVASRSQFIDGDGKWLPTKHLANRQSREIFDREIILKTRFSPTGVVVRRKAFDDCGVFDETLRSSEDRDMWIRIGARHRIFLLAEDLVLYRRHASSMSRNSARMKQNMSRVIAKARQVREGMPMGFGFWLRAKAFLFFQSGWMYFDERQRGVAIREVLISILLWPWFSNANDLNEPPLFRLRSLLRFLLNRRG